MATERASAGAESGRKKGRSNKKITTGELYKRNFYFVFDSDLAYGVLTVWAVRSKSQLPRTTLSQLPHLHKLLLMHHVPLRLLR